MIVRKILSDGKRGGTRGACLFISCAYNTAGGAVNRNYKVTIIIDEVTTYTNKTQPELSGTYRQKVISNREAASYQWADLGHGCARTRQ